MEYLYMIKNLKNKKVYIGITNNPKRRKKRHFSDLRNNKHDSKKLQNAFNKYGEDNFIFEVIFEDECSREDILKTEEKFIKKYNSFNVGYNMNEGGKENNGFKSRFSELDVFRVLSVYEFGDKRDVGFILNVLKTSRTTLTRMKNGDSHLQFYKNYYSLKDNDRKDIYYNFLNEYNVKKQIQNKFEKEIALNKEDCFLLLSIYEFHNIKNMYKKMSEKLMVSPQPLKSLKNETYGYKNIIEDYNDKNIEERQNYYKKALDFFEF